MAEIMAFLAAATLGLLAGAMLLIAVAITPFWASLEPIEFARWFRAIYPIYFTSANAALSGGSLDASQVAAELSRWRSWHWARTIAGVLGFLAALRGLALSIR